MKSQVLCVNREMLKPLGLTDESGMFNILPNVIPLDAFAFINRNVVDADEPKKREKDITYGFDIGKILPQILGYVTIINQNNEVLTYARKGTEARLHGLRSLGVGGHCDALDVIYTDQSDQKSLLDFNSILNISIFREIKEEIGIDFQLKDSTFLGLIQDLSNPVGQVHLGYSLLLHVNTEKQPLKLNPEEMLDASWESFETLVENYDLYENWSKMIINHFRSFVSDTSTS